MSHHDREQRLRPPTERSRPGVRISAALILGELWCLFAVSLANAAPATVLSSDIAPQPLAEALTAFAEQTGLQLFYVTAIAETQQSRGARAGLSPSAGLAQLLEGTGLQFTFVNARAVRIFPALTVVPTRTTSAAASPRQASGALGLEEVVVTGTRGQEPLSRVPIDMTVWSEQAMEVSHLEGIAQIAAFTPSVGFGVNAGASDFYTGLVMRGVTNLHGAAVALYIDDSPIPPIRSATYLLAYPMTFDLDRVEILRGPQTVLLGDHALSGAIKFIPNQPSLTTSTGLLRAELGTTEYGGMSYEAGAAVGGPITPDKLGFRVSGWFREEGGYIDRVDPFSPTVTLDADSNRILRKVVRGALTFAPTADVQLTPSLMYQSNYAPDQSLFSPSVSYPARGVFRNPSLVPQAWQDSYYLASLKLTARLRAAELSAVTSYFDQHATLQWGTTGPPFGTSATEPCVFGPHQHASLADVRLTSLDPDDSLTWVTGVLASGERAHQPFQCPPDGGDDEVITHNELAGFGQIAWRVNRRLTATAGVRVGHSSYDSTTDLPPPLQARDSDTWTAPRFGLSWQANERNLLYLTIARGYGSPGVYPQGPFWDPEPYPPDTLWSYEIGSKHTLWNDRLRIETSIFHVDWNNGPLESNLYYSEYKPAPGTAVSNGFGVTAEALLGERTKASVNIAYADAYLTQTLTLDGKVYVRKGDALAVSPWNVTASLEWNFPVRAGVTANIRAEDAFRSAPGPTFENTFYSATGATPLPIPDPSVNFLNLRAALNWSSFEVAAVLSNALGAHPTLYNGGVAGAGTPDGAGPNPATTLVPRTLSVSGTWRF